MWINVKTLNRCLSWLISYLTEHTLNGDMKVSLVLPCRVGDHTGVLALMGQQGVVYVEEMAALLDASMDVSIQQLKTNKIHQRQGEILCVENTISTLGIMISLLQTFVSIGISGDLNVWMSYILHIHNEGAQTDTVAQAQKAVQTKQHYYIMMFNQREWRWLVEEDVKSVKLDVICTSCQ